MAKVNMKCWPALQTKGIYLEEAGTYAETALIERVRKFVHTAGTRAAEVDIRQEDRTPEIADGSTIFLGRTIFAQIIGLPDLVLEECKIQTN